MPLHDWTKVVAGNFHDFHQTWMIAIKHCLNHGVLPRGYYALAEQVAKGPIPDVLTLERQDEWLASTGDNFHGAVALAESLPAVRYTQEVECEIYARRSDWIAIHHVNGDRVVAYLEILSPGNKHSERAAMQFHEKLNEALNRGCHVLVIDILPPGKHDPRGMHAAFWEWQFEESPGVTVDEPCGLASYCSDLVPRAYFQPIGWGQPLPDMPLFLTPDYYVNVPLEASYLAAWDDVPDRWKKVLESPA